MNQGSHSKRLAKAIVDTTASAVVSLRSGEFASTKMQMNVSAESYGIIQSVLTVNKTVYIIATREVPTFENLKVHEDDGALQYYNCDWDVYAMSPYELLMPVINIDLSRDIIDPRKLIGERVVVSEINGMAIKAEYIGELIDTAESPLTISRTLLRSVRNYIGGYKQLNDRDDYVKDVVKQFGLSEIVEKLYEHPFADWEGNVISFEQEGKYTNDTSNPKEGEVVIKPVEGYTRHLNREGMKSKNCHLPVKLFSAR